MQHQVAQGVSLSLPFDTRANMNTESNHRQHMMVWGSSREGMSAISSIAKIALLDDEALMLVSCGAVARDSLPPGFVRFLSEDEIIERGLQSYIPELMARIGRKRNPSHPVCLQKPTPYYGQFDKRKF